MSEEILKKILIVDDETNIRECGSRALKRRLKVHITTVDNGKDAVESIRAVAFDLILLDLTMPGLNGWEVIKKVREFNTTVKFIIITGHNKFTPVEDEIAKKDVVEVFYKPFDIPAITRKIAEIFGADISIDPICLDPELLKGRPEAREIVHTLKGFHSNIRIRCDEYLCAYKHGFYKDYSTDEHFQMLHAVLNDVIESVKLAQSVVEDIRKL